MVWQERRTSERHAVELPIRFRVLNEPREATKPSSLANRSQRTKNISHDGLLFLSPQQFKIGTLMALTFPIKDRTFTMEGHVIHSNRDSESGFYRTGIRFLKADSVFKVKMAEQLYQIDQYRKQLSKEEGRAISEEEAAHRWIEKHSMNFAEFYT